MLKQHMVEECFDNHEQVLQLSYTVNSWGPAVPKKVVNLKLFVMLQKNAI